MKIVLHNDQEHVVVEESKDFQLIQEKFSYNVFATNTLPHVDYTNSQLKLLYKGKLIAESGCGCCGDDIVRDDVMKMIQDMASKE